MLQTIERVLSRVNRPVRRELPDNKKARAVNRAGFLSLPDLDRYDIFCLWAFLALCDSELNFLAFGQSLEA